MFRNGIDLNMKCALVGDGQGGAYIEEGFIQKKRQRSSLRFGRQNLFNSCRASYFAPGQFEE